MVNDEIDNIDAIPIIKEMTILNDGKQFMVRIPKEVVDFFKIEKGDTFVFNIEIQEDNSINTFEVKKNEWVYYWTNETISKRRR